MANSNNWHLHVKSTKEGTAQQQPQQTWVTKRPDQLTCNARWPAARLWLGDRCFLAEARSKCNKLAGERYSDNDSVHHIELSTPASSKDSKTGSIIWLATGSSRVTKGKATDELQRQKSATN